MNLDVRRASAADAHEYRSIRLEALSLSPEAFGSTWEEVSTFPLAKFEEQLDRGCYFLAFQGNRVIGTSSFASYNFQRRRHAGLYGMYVSPDFQGRGVADSLVDMVKTAAVDEGYGTIVLSVNQAIRRAVHFYLRHGFTDTGHREPMRRDSSIHLMTMKAPLEQLA